MKPVDEYRSVRNWFLGLKPSTLKNYKRYLTFFCDFARLNPDKLLRLGKRDPTEAHTLAKSFYLQLERTTPLLALTRSTIYHTIRSFFDANDIRLGRSPRGFRYKAQYDMGKLMTRKELFDMITVSPKLRNKAIISFLAQSGQRARVLSAMKIGHVRTQLDHDIVPLIIRVRYDLESGYGIAASKSTISYRFAIGTETCDLLRKMIKQRRDIGEPIDDDSWLFKIVARWTPATKYKAAHPVNVDPKQRGEGLSGPGLTHIIHKAAINAGIQAYRLGPVPGGRWGGSIRFYEVYPHMFRRYWKHQMREGGVRDNDLLKYMMGQTPTELSAYDRFDDDYVKREYRRAEPYLSVLTSPRILPVPNIDGMEQFTRAPVRTHQKIVKEPELETCLTSGWRYVATLPSGRIVIETSAS